MIANGFLMPGRVSGLRKPVMRTAALDPRPPLPVQRLRPLRESAHRQSLRVARGGDGEGFEVLGAELQTTTFVFVAEQRADFFEVSEHRPGVEDGEEKPVG